MTTQEGKTNLAGWTQDRWDRTITAYQEQRTSALWGTSKNSRPSEAATDDTVKALE